MIDCSVQDRIIDVKSDDHKQWSVSGDVEQCVWAPIDNDTCYILVTTSLVIHKKKVIQFLT